MTEPMLPCPVDTFHTTTYGAIDPKQIELSQNGKNIAITGAGSGIGQAIAVSFARANVSNVALLGRRLETLRETEGLIQSENPKVGVHLFQADVSDELSLEAAFKSFSNSVKGPIHTLIANAGSHPGFSLLLELPTDSLMKTIITNGVGVLRSIRAFMPYAPKDKDRNGYRAQVIHTSSEVVQYDAQTNNGYALPKVLGTKIVQALAEEVPDVWFLNFHPGDYNTALATDLGFEFPRPDDIILAGDWVVWAAAKASGFVPSGRFLWAHWDVTEIEEIFRKMKAGELKDGGLAFEQHPTGRRFTLGISGVPDL